MPWIASTSRLSGVSYFHIKCPPISYISKDRAFQDFAGLGVEAGLNLAYHLAPPVAIIALTKHEREGL